MLLGALMLFGEAAVRGRGRAARMGSGAARQLRPRPLGRTWLAVLAGLSLLVILALGIPVGEIVHLLLQGGSSTLPTTSLLGATGTTFLYSASAGLLATAGALPVAMLSVRFHRRQVRALERSNMLILAVPGLVIALGFTYFTNHYLAGRFYQTPGLLVVTYAVMFFPMAVVVGAGRRGPVAGRAGGGRPLVGRPQERGLLAGHAAPHRTRAGGRLLPGLPRGGHRAHRHPRPHPHQRADPGHPVLGLPDQSLVQPGRAPGRGSRPHRRRAQLRAGTLVRPPARPCGPRGGARSSGSDDAYARSSGHAKHNGAVMKGLSVVGVTKSFGGQPVLQGVDVVVPEGSFTAILGASGSGKTTLLRIIAGFDRPDAGEVRLGAQVVDDAQHRFVPCEKRRIGYVPQEGALFPHLNVGRNVAFGLSREHRRRHDPRVDELLELVGLAGLARRYPHQLSGGQQQRVALARALAAEPEIVLLDEPFSSLDASLRASVRADVHEVLRLAGTTSILVTHDQDEALSMADQVAVLREGRIAQIDSPAGLYGSPRDAGLAQFMGEANLVEGTLEGDRVDTALGRLAATGPAAGTNGNFAGAASSGGAPTRSAGMPAGGAVRAWVMIRPEQIVLTSAGSGAGAGAETGAEAGASRQGVDGIEGVVQSYEYFGHDAVVRVRPESDALPVLTVRITGGEPVVPGTRVNLAVRGSVVAWPESSGITSS